MSLLSKNSVYRVLGPSWGRVFVSTFNWLFTGRFIDEGGQIATNVANTAIEDITEHNRLQAQRVAQAKAALAKIQRLYDGMVQTYNNYGSQAEIAVRDGKEKEAAFVIAAQLKLEESIGQARRDLVGAQAAVAQAEAAFREAQEELESFKLQQQSLEIQNQINESRKEIAEVAAGSSQTLQSAKAQFKQASEAVRGRSDRQEAMLGLQESETSKALKSLGQATVNATVEERIAQLRAGKAPLQLPVSVNEKQTEN